MLSFWDSVSAREARAKAELQLAEVGLAGSSMDRLPSRLSGGERQRTGIARELACRPTIGIADEPTASLDVSVQAQILWGSARSPARETCRKASFMPGPRR